MAVPRTHDGSLGPRSASRSTVTILAGLLAAVSVACLVFLGVRYGDASGSVGDRVGQVFGGDVVEQGTADDVRTRKLVLSQADQFVLRLNNYGPDDLDAQGKMPGYAARVNEVITPKFSVEFEKNVTLAEQAVADRRIDHSAQLYSSGAESIGEDVATVLVSGVITQVEPDEDAQGETEYQPQVFRFQLSMVKVDGTWLTDNFKPVTVGEDEPADPLPTDTPTGQPTDADPQAVARYARVVAGRSDAVLSAITRVDACGFPAAADPASAACKTAPDTLAAASRTLAVALRDAADPSAGAGYIGTPPDSIAELVRLTRQAAGIVVTASQTLRPTCVTSGASACTAQRTALIQSAANLLGALDGWGSIG